MTEKIKMEASSGYDSQKYPDEYFAKMSYLVRADLDRWLVYGLCNPRDYEKLKAYDAWLKKYSNKHWEALNRMQENHYREPDPRFTAALKAVAEAMARE